MNSRSQIESMNHTNQPRTGKPKRRKATRACVHCQRTHLTCDNNRPCERCIARGLAETCRDGVRKKAKYLNDVPEEIAHSDESIKYDPRYQKKPSSGAHEHVPSTGSSLHITVTRQDDHGEETTTKLLPSSTTSNNSSNSNLSKRNESAQVQDPSKSPELHHQKQQQQHRGSVEKTSSSSHANSSVHLSANPRDVNVNPNSSAASGKRRSARPSSSFESPALNLEYAVISDMLRGNAITNTNPQAISTNLSSASPAFSDDSNGSMYSGGTGATTATTGAPAFSAQNQFLLTNSPSHNFSELLASIEPRQQQSSDWLTTDARPRPISFTIADAWDDNGSTTSEFDWSTANANTYSLQTAPTATPATPTTSTSIFSHLPADYPQRKRPADIYTNVRSPFPYTLGYRKLFRYLKSRFQREQMIQMAQCMSRYRPSFIACTNSLDRDDLVFMEQCFQRTLLEYEKYIGASGTPTAVWRRTGQIAAVGKEFCILTGWTRKQLLHRDGPQDGDGMFIVEVMQDESVLEYFQMFSDISFGDSRDAMMSECMLRSASGQTIRTASIWTLKRDVFGIPMMIIGNFLPILS